MHAPTSNPPLLPPPIESLGVEVYLFSMRYSAAAMKSSKTFCLFSFRPASCHSLPAPPAPRIFPPPPPPPPPQPGGVGAREAGGEGNANPAVAVQVRRVL